MPAWMSCLTAPELRSILVARGYQRLGFQMSKATLLRIIEADDKGIVAKRYW